MIEEIFASVSPGETRVACMEGGRAVELHRFLHGRSTSVGNIYLGRVTRMVPGLGAAFVEIGGAKAGFLPLRDGGLSAKPLHEGARVIVQITREGERGKGPQLSTAIRIPGYLLVFAPNGGGIHVARRIGHEAQSERLAAAIAVIARPEEGWIARTNAADAGAEALAREADMLRTEWFAIVAASGRASPPAILYSEPSPIGRVLRDKAGKDLRRVVVDDAGAYTAAQSFLRDYLPQLQRTLARHTGSLALFEQEGIEPEFEALPHRRVPLPSGGTVIIERTEALWAIDVNTGRNVSGSSAEATILATNIEAAAEVARQIRLRDLGGLLIVDFVHMEEASQREQVLAAFQRALAGDPSSVRLTGFSDLGLVELSRRRTRVAMSDEFDVTCPTCNGRGSVPAPIVTALAALRAAAEHRRSREAAAVRISVSPAVADAFGTEEGRQGREELSAQLGRPVVVVPDPTMALDRFKIG